MRAVGLNTFGGPEVVEILEIEVPEPGAEQVRIAVEAAAVNPVDVGMREGVLLRPGFIGKPPVTLGFDVTGVVEAVGPGVHRLSVGDRVIGISTHLFEGPMAQSEFVVLNETAVAAVPRELDPEIAATLPLAGLTAWQALDALDLRRGQTLLVTGAGGAVGGFALQLARLRGLRVVAAASTHHAETIAARGAEWFVECHDLARNVRSAVPGGVDGALDAALLGQPSLDAVVEGGAHVSLMVLDRPIPLRGVRSVSIAIRPDWEQLTLISSLAATGGLHLGGVRSFLFAEAADAHKQLAAGGLGGNRLVLRP